MTERWRRELTRLKGAQLPADLWDRIEEGPQLAPLGTSRRSRVAAAVTALAMFAVAAVLLWRVFAPAGTSDRTLAGLDVVAVPARGDVAPVFLPDGRPVFVVHHLDGTVTVVDAFSTHRAWGIDELNVWCPTTRQFVELAHEAHFDEYGNWDSAGPAPSGLATFDFDVVEEDPSGDPAAIRVGEMRDPSSGGSAPVTDPSRPPVCPPADGTSNELLAHTLDASSIFGSPAEALAASPEGWFAVRGKLLVSREDGFVQLCGEVRSERCVNGAIVRGIDGVGLLVNVLIPYPDNGYEENEVWLAQARNGVLENIAGAGFLEVRRG